MTSNQTKPKNTSRWGNLLSGAVAGLESRLDNIFAEEEERARQERAAGKTVQDGPSSAIAPKASAKAASRASTNDRLQERLAKAVANQKVSSQPTSGVPSRSATPLLDSSSPRISTGSRRSTDLRPPSLDVQPVKTDEEDAELARETKPNEATLLSSGLPINPARTSEDVQASSIPDVSVRDDDVADDDGNSAEDNRDSITPALVPSVSAAESSQSENGQSQAEIERKEEMHSYLERIDALQAKLQYLAKETVAAAKQANSAAPPGSLDQRIAEKDERIALLMEEGSKLSKTEMRHLATIKKLRSKTMEEEKNVSDLQKKLTKLEQSESDLKQKLKQVEQAEKQTSERLKRLQKVEKDLDSTKSDLESSKAIVAVLRKQLEDAEKRADEAEHSAQSKASQVDMKKVSELEDQLSRLRTEKSAAEDRFAAELRRAVEASQEQQEKSAAREAELAGEVINLESRIEALRSKAEQATSDLTGDAQAKLLRQIETLQTQYSLAAENWRTIEGSLNSRISAVEKERDEYVKRESDVRKKARDISSKSRRAEEELDRVSEEHQALSQQLLEQKSETKNLQTRCSTAEKALDEAKADFERQKRILESEFHQKLEVERSKNMQHSLSLDTDMPGPVSSHTQSPTGYFRKSSAHESLNPINTRRNMQRLSSYDQSPQLASRRASALGPPAAGSSRVPGTSELSSPGVSRHSSALSLSQLNGHPNGMPPPLSVHTPDVDNEDGFDSRSSPQRTINDMISASTAHTGPSVQLVERMSSSIRRLESEKAAHKDELARLVSQRDESRNEVVALMRAMEHSRQADSKTAKLETELGEVKQRYEACLEILGEREEEVEELKGDVVELKRIYRDLAERSMK